MLCMRLCLSVSSYCASTHMSFCPFGHRPSQIEVLLLMHSLCTLLPSFMIDPLQGFVLALSTEGGVRVDLKALKAVNIIRLAVCFYTAPCLCCCSENFDQVACIMQDSDAGCSAVYGCVESHSIIGTSLLHACTGRGQKATDASRTQ